MKIIGAVVLALFAGILSSTNADGIEEDIRSLCDRNGGPKAYEIVENITAITNNIFQSAAEDILQEYNNSISDELDNAITAYCGKVGILSNSIHSFIDAVKPCLEPADRDLEGLNNFTASLMEFPCANRHLVKGLLNSTDGPCIVSKLDSLVNCGQDILATRNTTITNNSSPEIDSDETSRLEVEPENKNQTCSDVRSFEDCSVRVLAECEDQIFSRTLDALYKYINNELPCENLLKSPK